MAALALPLALFLGLLADLAGGLAARLAGGDRRWWSSLTGPWHDARRLWRARRRRARPAVAEALGALAALTGGGVAAAAALGLVPGSVALVYLALVLAAVGTHLARPLERTVAEASAARWRLEAALAESAFLVALGAMFLRWQAADLEAIRGTQTVLGPGIGLGPGSAAVALAVAGLVAVVAGALRLAPSPDRRRGAQSRGAGSSLLLTPGRWAAAGATALVVATPLAGRSLSPAVFEVRGALVFMGAAALAAVLLGVSGALIRRLRPGWRSATASLAFLVAAGMVALVVLA
jgi:hypothetical protein